MEHLRRSGALQDDRPVRSISKSRRSDRPDRSLSDRKPPRSAEHRRHCKDSNTDDGSVRGVRPPGNRNALRPSSRDRSRQPVPTTFGLRCFLPGKAVDRSTRSGPASGMVEAATPGLHRWPGARRSGPRNGPEHDAERSSRKGRGQRCDTSPSACTESSMASAPVTRNVAPLVSVDDRSSTG